MNAYLQRYFKIEKKQNITTFDNSVIYELRPHHLMLTLITRANFQICETLEYFIFENHQLEDQRVKSLVEFLISLILVDGEDIVTDIASCAEY